MTEWGHTRTIFTIAHSPSSPSLKSGGPFLAECISGFPAFAENDEMGSFPRTIFTIAHSPSSPSLQSAGSILG
jgi:hypothetical protein